MVVARAKESHLEQIVGQASESTASCQIKFRSPLVRGKAYFEFDMLPEFFQSFLFKPLHNGLSCLGFDFFPVIVHCIIEIPGVNDSGDGILILRGS